MAQVSFPGPILSEALEALEEGVDTLLRHFPPPLYVAVSGGGHFRYAAGHRTSQLFQVLKAVRVVSGFHAAIHLVHVRHHQEAAVVLRAVDEALQDIDVIDEAHVSSSGPMQYQKRLVDEFFTGDDVGRVQRILEGQADPIPRVPRKKKRAAVERRLSSVAKGRPIRSGLNAIDAVLDGYVHCGYAQIMEMYSASPRRERFHMRGVDDPGRFAMFAQWIPLFVHHALNAVAKLLYDTKYNREADRLVDIRNRLESSEEYGKGAGVA